MPNRKIVSSHDSLASRDWRYVPPLLALPSEVRCMIWIAVVDLPILLFITKQSQDIVPKVVAFWSKALGPDYIEIPCTKLHQSQPHGTAKGPGPLSWLRTNREIYLEAQPIVYRNLSLHICDPFLLQAVMFDGLLEKKPIPNIIRSLSFCLRVQLEHDAQNGYSFASGVKQEIYSWPLIQGGRRGPCGCALCFAFIMGRKFPRLKEVRFRTYFTCREREYNYRPTVDQWQPGRLRNGSSYQPANPSPVVWTGDQESMRRLVCDLLDERPLGIFKLGRPKSVVVDFATRGIEHNPFNRPPHPHSQCWCTRNIDLESIPRTLFTKTIKTQISRW